MHKSIFLSSVKPAYLPGYGICCTRCIHYTVNTAISTIMAALLATILSVQMVAATKTPFTDITYRNGQETCLSTEQQNIALQKVKDNVYQYLFNRSILPQCGEGIWYRVAYLNMADSSQQCPSAWREYNTSQFRAYGRPVSSGVNCPSQIFPISCQYSKVAMWKGHWHSSCKSNAFS